MMLVVSDANRQSLTIAGTIARMAHDAGIPRVALIGNRIVDAGQERVIADFARAHDLAVMGMIPFDPAVVRVGIAGDAISALEGSAALCAIRDILSRIDPERQKRPEAGADTETIS
jgi:CO dehydrogenase nickel-insertion accessory protein CooC1